jgi:hypothetical protein
MESNIKTKMFLLLTCLYIITSSFSPKRQKFGQNTFVFNQVLMTKHIKRLFIYIFEIIADIWLEIFGSLALFF